MIHFSGTRRPRGAKKRKGHKGANGEKTAPFLVSKKKEHGFWRRKRTTHVVCGPQSNPLVKWADRWDWGGDKHTSASGSLLFPNPIHQLGTDLQLTLNRCARFWSRKGWGESKEQQKNKKKVRGGGRNRQNNVCRQNCGPLGNERRKYTLVVGSAGGKDQLQSKRQKNGI